MVNNFIFIEEGSLDTNNMLKLLQNSGMTDANVIRYKQGTAKPELINIESEGSQISLVEHDKNLKKLTEAKITASLLKFLNECCEVTLTEDHVRGTKYYSTRYIGKPESLVEDFKQFLAEEDNSWM